MTLIDFFLLLVIGLSLVSGYQRGFILGVLDLLFVALGLIFAFRVSGYLATFLAKYLSFTSVWTLPMAFILCYVFARIILWVLTDRSLRRVPASAHTSAVNRLAGIIPGLLSGLIYVAILSSLLLAVPFSDSLAAKTRESIIASSLTPHVQWAEEKLAPVFEDAINHSIHNLTVKPGSKNTIELDFTVPNPKIREDLERQMLVMVNEERRKHGLPSLNADPEMREVARAHSRDMFAKGYFSHINKEGETPFERAREHKVRFLAAGENLALAPTLNLAHTGLMNSPGHRANILHPAFGRVGIGILDGGRYGIMVTQNFRN